MSRYLFIASEFGSHNALYPVLKELSKKATVGYVGVKDPGDLNLVLKRICPPEDGVKKLFSEFDLFFTGTSGCSMLEYNAWYYARSCRKRSVCILDQWKNYKERFYRNKKLLFPDLIFVMDTIARRNIVNLGASQKQVIVTGSPYLDNLIKRSAHSKDNAKMKDKLGLGGKKIITFCTESIIKLGEKKKYGYDERIIIGDILEYIKGTTNIILIIKLHPADDAMVYKGYEKFPFVRVADGISSMDFFELSDIVIGMNSMALLEAYIMKVPVISYQPVEKESIRDDARFILDIAGIENTVLKKKSLHKRLEDALAGKFVFKEFYVRKNSVRNIMEQLLNCEEKYG